MHYFAQTVLLYACLGGLTAQPMVSLVSIHSTSQCNNTFIVLDGQDTSDITFEISGSNTNYLFDGFDGPNFFYKSANNIESPPCSLLKADGSCDGTRRNNSCYCKRISSDVYHLTFIKIAAIADSGGKTYIKWAGQNGAEFTSDEETLPEVTDVCPAPSITLMSKSDTSQCNSSILIEGGDKTTIAFKISGSNASYRFDGAYSPKICFTSSDGAEFADQCCPLLEVDDSCNSTRADDDCHCEQISPDTYLLTYIKIAALKTSSGKAYVEWPSADSSPVLRSEYLSLPEVRDSCLTAITTEPPTTGGHTASDDCEYCCKMGSCKEGCCVGAICGSLAFVCACVTGGGIGIYKKKKGKKKVSDEEDTAKGNGKADTTDVDELGNKPENKSRLIGTGYNVLHGGNDGGLLEVIKMKRSQAGTIVEAELGNKPENKSEQNDKGKKDNSKDIKSGDQKDNGGGEHSTGNKDNYKDIESGDQTDNSGGEQDEPPPGENQTSTPKALGPLRNAPPMPPKGTENMTSSTTPAASDQQDSSDIRKVKKKQKKTREEGVADIQDQESNVSSPDEKSRSPRSASSVRLLPTPNISTNGTQNSGLHNQGFTQKTRPPSIDESSLERHRHGKRL